MGIRPLPPRPSLPSPISSPSSALVTLLPSPPSRGGRPPSPHFCLLSPHSSAAPLPNRLHSHPSHSASTPIAVIRPSPSSPRTLAITSPASWWAPDPSNLSCIGISLFFVTMIHFVLLISRQGKVRLTKWYSPYTQKERIKVIRELSGMILSRGPKLCNFLEWRGLKIVYKRYASLYFCMCVDADDNELETLEIIHHYVEILDRYFGNVCELDLIFNFHKAYYILDEVLIAGELQETSKKSVARVIAAQDTMIEHAKEQSSSLSNIIAQATK